MAYEIRGFSFGTLDAAADLSADAGLFVKVNSSGQVALCNTLGELAVGVLMNKPTSGQPCTVDVSGVAKVVAGAALNPGPVTTDANGKAVQAGAGQYQNGIALAAAAGAGVVVPVLLKQAGKQ